MKINLTMREIGRRLSWVGFLSPLSEAELVDLREGHRRTKAKRRRVAGPPRKNAVSRPRPVSSLPFGALALRA